MHIRRAQMSDISNIATVAADAMADDRCIGSRSFLTPYGYLYPEARRHNFARRCRIRFYQGRDIWVAVTDPTDHDWDGQEHITGYMAMYDSEPEQQPSLAMQMNLLIHRMEDSYRTWFHQDPSMSTEHLLAMQRTQAEVDDVDIAGLSGKRHHYCEHLSVAPAYQRRGIAQSLLRHAQDLAGAKGLPILLVASPKGESTYLKAGFREVGRVPFAEGSGIVDPVLRWDPPNVPSGVQT